MPNVASILKSEISRVARKEVRAQTSGLKKATGTHRSDIAALKRRIQTLEQLVRRLGKPGAKAQRAEASDDEPSNGLRFSAKGLKSQRKRLGLSAHDCGLLVGASGQSVYKWEEGAVRPRARQLPAIAALRKMGKKEVTAQLEALKGA